MGGIRRICRAYGGMKIGGIDWVWDYMKEEPVKKTDMTKEEWAASEKRRWEIVSEQIAALKTD